MGFMTGQRIYENFVGGIGPTGLANSSEVVRELVAEYEEEAAAIRRLVARMESVWRGAAAGAAQHGAGPLATEYEQAAPPLGTAQDLNSRQAGSFAHARNSVVPVPPQPGPPDPWAVFRDRGPVASYYQQVVGYQAATQHNVDVMTDYTQAARYNTEGMPRSYGSLLLDRATVTVEPGSPTSAEDDPRHAEGERPSRTEPVVLGPPSPDDPEPPRDNTSAGSDPAAVPTGATPSGATPAGTATGTAPSGTTGGAQQAPGGLTVERGAPHSVPTDPGIPRNGTVVGPREPVSNGRAVGPSVPPAGGRAGATTGGALPMAAGGRNRGEPDRERHAPEYLREEDAEAVFGTDEPTAPSVMGAETG